MIGVGSGELGVRGAVGDEWAGFAIRLHRAYGGTAPPLPRLRRDEAETIPDWRRGGLANAATCSAVRGGPSYWCGLVSNDA